jgi:uncharacterized membrane protein (DUF485 family)
MFRFINLFLFKIVTAFNPEFMGQPMYPKMARENARIVKGRLAKKGQFPFQVN